MIKIAICDDENIFIENYIEIINNIKKDNKYNIEIHTFNSGKDLIKYTTINDVKFDLVFLDIIMKEINGIDTAKLLKRADEHTEIVFLTSSKEYALDSYDIKAFNYIIKSSEQLESKIYEAIKNSYEKKDNYIVINNKSFIEKIQISKIIYIESNKRKIIFNTVDGKHETYEKLDNIYEKLESYGFVKTHRSYIINMYFIKKIGQKELITTTGDIILISRSNTDIVRDRFIKYLEDL